MKALLFFTLLTLCSSVPLDAQSLNSYRWKSRVVLLFTPTPEDPVFQRQVELLYGQVDELEERNVVFMFITPDGKFENTGRFLDQAASQKMYQKFGAEEFQVELVLVGLDGHEKFRARNRITPPSVLMNLIDTMPMRAAEIRGKGNRSQIANKKSGTAEIRRNY
ncbi:DUF4174 domain-containing protein [Neolewinella aurantiaca]|uniref:DUF4174 domain-containing protein n=1 Tax=Neolewinella aurantiaca TaxID=2602767 RepID=A0A5C7FFC0_9BACT|nr:DUF4174 domain-containing protein [Neolewinella aurantiaca]TXF88293.1 DUF4174 domain-containing protein [Neolewinella aurantiaca]